jgi:lipoprotein-releasing system permease protein
MVALRHLRSRRKHAFVSLITVISILGIMVGVAALITVISVMTGFSSYMQDRILGTTSHILITGVGGIDWNWMMWWPQRLTSWASPC